MATSPVIPPIPAALKPVTTTANTSKMHATGLNTDLSGGISDNTNNVFKTGSIGSVTDAISSSIYGINHRQTPGAIQLNKDFFGLTFFTKPDMNMTWDNIKDIRQLAPLLSADTNSIPRVIRLLLDCRLQGLTGIKSDLVDPQQAFIPMLTNHLLSISGWPDVIVPTMTSQEGTYKEAFSMADGITQNYSTYDMQANFRNIPGDPITALFLYWVHYQSYVFQGELVPYPDNIINNTIDYQTRIYRLVLDSSKTYVKKIAACGAAFPLSTPIGAAFNYEHNTPISDSNHQISIPFRCMGAMYQDDILIDEFNKTGAMFNSQMDKEATAIELAIAQITASAKNGKISDEAIASARTGTTYIKLLPNELTLFNNRGYPHININTYELGWFVSIDMYNSYFPTSGTIAKAASPTALKQIQNDVSGAANLISTYSNLV